MYYRAPELLLGCAHYSAAIDLWSVGCVMAELANFDPLFRADSEVGGRGGGGGGGAAGGGERPRGGVEEQGRARGRGVHNSGVVAPPLVGHAATCVWVGVCAHCAPVHGAAQPRLSPALWWAGDRQLCGG